jgi:hypothetical protein
VTQQLGTHNREDTPGWLWGKEGGEKGQSLGLLIQDAWVKSKLCHGPPLWLWDMAGSSWPQFPICEMGAVSLLQDAGGSGQQAYIEAWRCSGDIVFKRPGPRAVLSSGVERRKQALCKLGSSSKGRTQGSKRLSQRVGSFLPSALWPAVYSAR